MASSHTKCRSETTQNTIKLISSSKITHQANQNNLECSFLIIGGGIAGVSCAETINFLAPHEKTIIISESSLIKSVTNLVQLGKYIQQFDVEEVASENLVRQNLQVINDQLKSIESKSRQILTTNGLCLSYKHLCICTGARPKVILSEIEEFVLGIRDTESAEEFQKRIKTARRFALVGNGGIASEIAFEVSNIEIDWIIKDKHISSNFIDAGAAKFFETRLHNKDSPLPDKTIVKRMRYIEESRMNPKHKGAALGPDWHQRIDLSGSCQQSPNNIRVHFGTEVKRISRNINGNFPITVELTDGSKVQSDFVVSATGVHPHATFSSDVEFQKDAEGGICVNEMMKTSVDHIFAAGDICSANWEHSKLWHQMKLWTQARQMGMMAGKSMVALHEHQEIYQDFCFELFSHVTKLYGYQVVLLGNFNGQGLDNDYELLFRITPDKEYIKFVLKEGRLVGALLIGETGLEETCENLILNQIDLTPFGDDILNPNIDIEDYFD